MSRTLFASSPQDAAGAAAEALADGMTYEAVGEAISLAANQLVLRDLGRTAEQAQPNKPVGSVHGDSIGVHACDSANAWRNMVPACDRRNAVACLILGAYQVALDRVARGGDFLHWEPWPQADHLEVARTVPAERLLPDERRPFSPTIRPEPVPWSIDTANWICRPDRSSICCSTSRSVKTVRCTPKSITAR